MEIDYTKNNGLVPAIIQDVATGKVLMLGYMNQESIEKTRETGNVTFYSRSKQRLWTKGETSGNFLKFKSMRADCDKDTLLVFVDPVGPACHTGADTCFNEENKGLDLDFLNQLTHVIKERKENPTEKSYTASLFQKGINKIAQKVGEEAVEVVIEAKDDNAALFENEAADLLYHYMILLEAKGYTLADISKVLEGRHK